MLLVVGLHRERTRERDGLDGLLLLRCWTGDSDGTTQCIRYTDTECMVDPLYRCRSEGGRYMGRSGRRILHGCTPVLPRDTKPKMHHCMAATTNKHTPWRTDDGFVRTKEHRQALDGRPPSGSGFCSPGGTDRAALVTERRRRLLCRRSGCHRAGQVCLDLHPVVVEAGIFVLFGDGICAHR